LITVGVSDTSLCVKRSACRLIGFLAALGSLLVAPGTAGAAINTADDLELSAIGVDLPGVTANQPASIGNFAGKVGFAHFAGGRGRNFEKFDFDIRFQRGAIRTNSGQQRHGQWAFT
jgi:hypothetical protein